MAIFKSIKSAFRTVFCCSPASQVVDEEKHPYPPSYGAGSVPAHQIDYAAYQQYQLHKVQQQRLQEYAYPPPPPKPKPRHKSRPPKYTAPRVELIETKPLPAIPARVHPQYTYQYTPPRPPPVQPHVQVPVRVKVEQRSPTPPPLVHRIDYAGSPLVKPVSVQSSPRPAPLQAPPAVIQAPVVTRIERRPSIKQAERPPIKPVEARSKDAAGAQSSVHYQSLRNQAKAEGDAMAKSFADSQTAFKSKNGALAKQLSAEGKGHKANMERLNKQASEWIYRELNPGLPPEEIDLHGQFVNEAIELTEKAIRTAQRRGLLQLRVIVGKGIHSAADPKLKPAIQKHMNKLRLQCNLDPYNAGVLVVDLK